MKPQVTFNDIDLDEISQNKNFDKETIFKLTASAININSEGKEVCKKHKSYDIKKTTDGNKPYVIVVCSLEKGVDDNDRNY